MPLAIDQVMMAQCPIRYVMIDGNQFQPYQRILRRDDRILAIAAAAMLTETPRDKRIEALLAT